ncbi:hypothetical protein [Streptomyces sp. SM1]|nr:hypothetical protein [Streptomyces sp. SM1]
MPFSPFGHPALPGGAPFVDLGRISHLGCDITRAGRRRTPSSFAG